MSGGFDVNGPSNHLYIALIIDLIKRGHSVCLIQRYSYGNEPEIPEVLSNLEGFYYKKINVKRVKKSKFIIRYLKSVIYSFKSIKYLKKFSYCDLVFVQSCPTAPFQVKFAKKYVNKPVIYNI